MKYKQYPKYKDSGIEWIGEIPEGWEVNRLKFLCNITTGTKNTEDNESEGDYPFFVRSQKVEKISTYCCDEEAVLTAGDGVGVGKVFHYVNGKFDFHQRVYKMSDFKKILGKYFFYYFQENFKKEIFKGTAKSTVDSIRLHMIQDFPISFGSEEEQIQISEFLDKQTTQFDELIAKSKAQVTLLEEKIHATINQAVTKGLDPSVSMKDSGVGWIGDIPEHWKIEPLKFHVQINEIKLDDNTEDEFEISYIDVGSVHAGGKIDEPEIMKFANAPSRARRIMKKNDTILSTVRTYLKAIAFVDETTDGKICSTGFAVISPKKNIQSKFLYYLLSSPHYIDHVMANSVGVTYPAINSSDLGIFPIPLLPSNEAQEISEFLDKQTTQFDELIAKSKAQVTLLEEKRQALITAAVTGKIDVRGIVV